MDVARAHRAERHTSKTFATYRRLNVASSGWLEADRSVSPLQE